MYEWGTCEGVMRDVVMPQACVEFVVNAPLGDLRQLLGRALLGVHTMWNEHFGIGIVEMMVRWLCVLAVRRCSILDPQAAGVLPVAHNTGGPRADIVTHGVTGFLAAEPAEYADAFVAVLDDKVRACERHPHARCVVCGRPSAQVDVRAMATAARKAATQFSDAGFAAGFVRATRVAFDGARRPVPPRPHAQ